MFVSISRYRSGYYGRANPLTLCKVTQIAEGDTALGTKKVYLQTGTIVLNWSVTACMLCSETRAFIPKTHDHTINGCKRTPS